MQPTMGAEPAAAPTSSALRTITGMSDSVLDPATVPGARTVELPPDASILDAVGRGHTLASALADLIDNSVDAGASRVSIRFVTKRSTIRSIRISDDGCGMNAQQLERAMALGRQHAYEGDSIGHFGVGLKGASFSQASVLTVYSATGYTPAAAMRLGRGQTGSGITAEVFDSGTAASLLRRRGFEGESGTLVEWTQLEAVSVATSVQERRRWVESMILQVRDELGLTFHRMLADRRLRIELEEIDEETGESGAPRAARPIDPFDFERWGAKDYPREIVGRAASGVELHARCFILPPGVDGGAAQLLGRNRRESQGLYIYRNDRLLQAGGWLGLRGDAPSELQLARIKLDIDGAALDIVAINPEKRGVVLRPEAVQALGAAVTDGFTLRSFWAESDEVWTGSRRRSSNAQPVAALGEGVPAALRTVLEQTVGVSDDGGVAVSFVWEPMPQGQLFAFEPSTGIVKLNVVHRASLEEDTSRLDLIKTSLFMTLEPHAGKERLGPSTVQRLNAMQAAMAASLGMNQPEAPAPDAAKTERDDEPDSDPPAATKTALIERLDTEIEVFPAVVSEADPYEPLADPKVAHVHVGDTLDDYGRLAKRTPLLSAEEEVELAKQIEAGVLAEARMHERPSSIDSREVRRDYAELVARGRRAFDQMVVANLRLVIAIARRHRGNGLELVDLVQEGNGGLIHAVQLFDYAQGTKFSTYATWWIRQAVTRAIADKGRLIRLPVHVVEKLPRIEAAWAESSGPHSARIEQVAESQGEKAAMVRAITAAMHPILSLDAPRAVEMANGTWTHVTLAEELRDEAAVSAEDLVGVTLLHRQLEQLLDSLTEREAGVIRMRFGLGDGAPKTLEEIGRTFGITRERVRQILTETTKKLRHPSRSSGLRDYCSEDIPSAGVAGLTFTARSPDDVVDATRARPESQVFEHVYFPPEHPIHSIGGR